MRASLAAVVGSVFAHALVLAWLTSDIEVPPVEVATPVEVEATTPPTPPTEVELVFYETPSTGGEVVGSSAQTKRVSSGHGTSRVAGEQAPSSKGSGDGKPTHSPLMSMRKPGEIELEGLSGTFWAKFAENTKPLPPPPDIPSERVSNEIHDLEARLKSGHQYSADELTAMRMQLVALREELKNEELEPAGGGEYKTEKETFRGRVAQDGSIKLTDKPENMDSQDRLMLEHGIDPYLKAKLDYLDRTRDQRVAIGKRFREQELKKSTKYMQQHISRLWAMTTDVQKRKQGLFELWDECTEKGPPEEVAAGEEARAYLMTWIRGKVTYTPQELDALNSKRQSTQVFAP